MNESLGQYAARDGKSISYRKWNGAGNVIVYLHGIESNSGWFFRFASDLNARGFTLYGIDRRGSGLNREERGDISDYNIFFDDIEDIIEFARRQNTGKKIFLIGICWGALLAVNYIAKGKNLPDGLILLSPAIYRKVDMSPLVKAAAKFCFLLRPGLRFKIPIKDGMFTANGAYLDFIKKDNMRLKTLTARFFNEIIKMERGFRAINHNINVPVCVLLAGHDDIVDNDKVKAWFAKIESTEKTIKVFDELHHVMPFEKNIEPLIDFITDWIERREAAVESHSVKN